LKCGLKDKSIFPAATDEKYSAQCLPPIFEADTVCFVNTPLFPAFTHFLQQILEARIVSELQDGRELYEYQLRTCSWMVSLEQRMSGNHRFGVYSPVFPERFVLWSYFLSLCMYQVIGARDMEFGDESTRSISDVRVWADHRVEDRWKFMSANYGANRPVPPRMIRYSGGILADEAGLGV